MRVVVLGVALVLLVGFAAVLAELTLTPSPASSEIAGANLRPGRSLRQYAEDYTFLAACKQVGGNVLMGAPFGLLLPVLVPRRFRLLRVVGLTLVVMTVVELAQGAIVEGRAFDVDDVIMNTTGAFLAYLLLGRRLSRHFHTLGFVVKREPAAAKAVMKKAVAAKPPAKRAVAKKTAAKKEAGSKKKAVGKKRTFPGRPRPRT
ncbi:VanZ family protein [Streptomyces sp. NBC_01716]|uniref:VanZ family protein n=1 Tax=Streptomyces sp. NBC_01716 TaxID=2975917 RepID=UPI002E35BA78|nr:VanZ family protein [Streptomyces sp. NBC_01716]